MIELEYIKLEDCKHGFLYRLYSDNLKFGVFNENALGFIGIKDDKYLFTGYHIDNDNGTVQPVQEIEQIPDDIPILDALGMVCTGCGRDIQFILEKNAQKSVWHHLDDSKCTKVSPDRQENFELLRYLKGVEEERPTIPPKVWKEKIQ